MPADLQRARSVSSLPHAHGAAPKLIRVVLADDHELMRARLRALLDADESVEVVADTAELADAINHVFRTRPHVLVLDMSMSSGSSIGAIRSLRSHVPGTQVVVMKMQAIAPASKAWRALPQPAGAHGAGGLACGSAAGATGPVGSAACTVVPPSSPDSSSSVPPTR